MDQIKAKLNRLPGRITSQGIIYKLRIERDIDDIWEYSYLDENTGNKLIEFRHKSLQACVDELLHILKTLDTPADKDLIKRVNQSIIDWYNDDSINEYLNNPNKSFSEVGFDSLDHVELIMKIESDFNIRISDDESYYINNLNDLYKIVNNKLK